MKIFNLAVCLTVALLTSACLPVTSKTPIGSSKGLAADVSLAGTWKLKLQGSTDNYPLWAMFVPAKDGSFTILLTGTEVVKGKAEGQWMQLKGRTARLGANNYLNVTTVTSDGEADKGRTTRDSIVLMYRANSPASIALFDGDERKFIAAIKAKKIAGTIANEDEVTLTAPAAALDAFFQGKDSAALFKPYGVLTKVN